MKGKLKQRILASFLSLMLVTTILSIPAKAATTYTPVNGDDSTKLKKYLVVDKDAIIPNATFEFSIAPIAQKIDATDSTVEILAGPGGTTEGKCATITASVTFAPTDSTINEEAKPAGETIKFATSSTTASDDVNKDEKYAEKELTVDLSSVSFDEPGIYRWVITEAASTQMGVTDDPELTRVLDVYVTDNNGALVVSSYVIHDGNGSETIDRGDDYGSHDVDTASAKLDDKSTGFTNTYSTKNLVFGKEVTGNQGSKDKYFKFIVTSRNVAAADEFTVDVSTHADLEPSANSATKYTVADMKAANNVTKITGADLNSGKVFYLQDGQYITIKGLPQGANYVIAEDAEDYKKTETIVKANSTLDWDASSEGNDALTDAVQGAIDTADIHTGFTNTKDGVIPTGILVSVTSWIILGIVVIAGIVFFAIRSKKKYEEE